MFENCMYSYILPYLTLLDLLCFGGTLGRLSYCTVYALEEALIPAFVSHESILQFLRVSSYFFNTTTYFLTQSAPLKNVKKTSLHTKFAIALIPMNVSHEKVICLSHEN